MKKKYMKYNSTMRKKACIYLQVLVFTVVLLLGFVQVPKVDACIMQINPSYGSEVRVEESKSFTLTRQVEHRRCPSTIDVIVLQLSNISMLDEGSWSISGRVATRTIKVQFIEPGQAVLRMSSSCALFPTRPAQLVFQVIAQAAETPSPEPPGQTEPPPEPTPEPSPDPGTEPNPEPQVPQVPADLENPPPTPKTEDKSIQAPPSLNGKEKLTEEVPVLSLKPKGDQGDQALPGQLVPTESNIEEDQDESLNPNSEVSDPQTSRIELDLPPLVPSPKRFFSFGRQELWMLFYFLALLFSWFLIQKKWYRWRSILLIASIGFFGFYAGGCLCPIGWVERFFLWIKHPAWGISSVVSLLLLLIFTFFKGRIFCGWVCPQGALQDVLLRKSLTISVSTRWERFLQWGRWIIFGWIAVMALFFSVGWFCQFDPFKAVFQLSGSSLMFATAFLVLGLSLFIYRPFCRFLCPLGALFSFANWLALRFGVQSDKLIPGCKSCQKCSNECASNALFLDKKQVKVRRSDCIECMECIKTCPIHDKA